MGIGLGFIGVIKKTKIGMSVKGVTEGEGNGEGRRAESLPSRIRINNVRRVLVRERVRDRGYLELKIFTNIE